MISAREWQNILAEIEARVPGSQFTLDTVAEVDEKNQLIYVKSFPGVPVPLFGFDASVKTYDKTLNSLEAWHEVGAGGEPAFANSWVNYDARTARFWKDPFGIVHLSGVIKDGTVGLKAFTLPEGYRPEGDFTWTVVTNPNAFGTVIIPANGDVVPSIASNVYFFLNGVTFRSAVAATPSVTEVKKREVDLQVPKRGDTVLLVRGLGAQGTVRCIGKVLSTGYMTGQ